MASLPAIEQPHPAGRRDSGLLIVWGCTAEGHASSRAAMHKAASLTAAAEAGLGPAPRWDWQMLCLMWWDKSRTTGQILHCWYYHYLHCAKNDLNKGSYLSPEQLLNLVLSTFWLCRLSLSPWNCMKSSKSLFLNTKQAHDKTSTHRPWSLLSRDERTFPRVSRFRIVTSFQERQERPSEHDEKCDLNAERFACGRRYASGSERLRVLAGPVYCKMPKVQLLEQSQTPLSSEEDLHSAQ